MIRFASSLKNWVEKVWGGGECKRKWTGLLLNSGER